MSLRILSHRFLAVTMIALVGAGAVNAGSAAAKSGTTTTTTIAKKVKAVTRKTACDILTKTQLETLLEAKATSGGRVNANKGLDVECGWTIAAAGDRPAGTVRMVVSFGVPLGADKAYAALKSNPQFQVVDGLGADALYTPANGTLAVFKGNRILRLRGLFNDTTVRPIRSYEPKLVLLVLAQAALPRL